MSIIIADKLYLGDIFDANNELFAKEKNITSIICVAEGLKIDAKNVNLFKYELQDNYECNISLYFDEIAELINKEKTVLVCCYAGISRSSTIVIAYIMKYHKKTLREAFLYVRNKRPCICPNKEFMKHLIDYEHKLYGQNYITLGECIKLFFYSDS